MVAYIDLLRTVAASAAEPGSEEVAEKYEDVRESTTVCISCETPSVLPWNYRKTIGAFPVISK